MPYAFFIDSLSLRCRDKEEVWVPLEPPPPSLHCPFAAYLCCNSGMLILVYVEHISPLCCCNLVQAFSHLLLGLLQCPLNEISASAFYHILSIFIMAAALFCEKSEHVTPSLETYGYPFHLK